MDGQIGFLPWMQKGLIKYSSDIEGATPASPPEQRTKIKVRITTNGITNIDKGFHLLGPGDVLSIDPSMVVRTQPANGVFNFSDNLMPFIEFADVDFPWQFTPAKANTANHLSSWLTLVVLKDDEYTVEEPAAEGLPKRLIIKPTSTPTPYGNYVHPQDEHWAWAHVQVTTPLVDPILGTASLGQFHNDLKTDPSVGISRLLCPRRLEPDTQYTAFLLPAYETGRLAGVGVTAPSTTPLQKLSWDTTATVAMPVVMSDPNNFPIYYSWRFGTALQGDFETLARAIVPRAMEGSLGGIKMDISNSGMGLNSLFVSPGPGTVSTVQMEGALAPDEFSPLPAQSVSSIGPSGMGLYTGKLNDVINLSANLADNNTSIAAALAATPPDNPYIPGLNYANDDPVILPPIYGQWHANVQKITGSTYPWVQQLNLDVRYRAAAGLGSKIVRENQEHFMEAAWNQVGDVLRVNDLMAKAKFAIILSDKMYKKHYVANAKSSVASSSMISQFGFGATQTETFSRTVNLGSKFLGKIRNGLGYGITIAAPAPSGTTTVPFLATNYNNATLKNVLSRSFATKGAVNSSFAKVVRNRSHPVRKLSLATNNRELVANISQVSSVVKAAPENISAPNHTMLRANLATMALANASMPFSVPGAMALFTPSVYNRSFGDFNAMLESYDSHEATYAKPSDFAIDNGTLIKRVSEAINPNTTIFNRIQVQIDLQYNGMPGVVTDINDKVMAYPVMDEPAYKYLVNISTEYLLPNLSQYPNNTVALLKSNNKFIEAFMAGLNHEFSKELLWRGYPTDQRGSYFRRFWDTSDTYRPTTLSTPSDISNYLYDINMMHKWGSSSLGDNNNETRHSTLSSDMLVLFIRADLLKKYPNTLIYAQKAIWANTISSSYPADSHALDESAMTTTSLGEIVPNPSIIQFPIFKAQLDPDVVLLGFRLTKPQVMGSPHQSPPGSDPGWFFVFRERPGQISFGMDNPPAPTTGTPPVPSFLGTWDNMNWDFMKSVSGSVSTPFPTARLGGLATSWPSNPILSFSGFGGLRWNNDTASPPLCSDSAQVASILFQDPVLIGIHGQSLLIE